MGVRFHMSEVPLQATLEFRGILEPSIQNRNLTVSYRIHIGKDFWSDCETMHMLYRKEQSIQGRVVLVHNSWTSTRRHRGEAISYGRGTPVCWNRFGRVLTASCSSGAINGREIRAGAQLYTVSTFPAVAQFRGWKHASGQPARSTLKSSRFSKGCYQEFGRCETYPDRSN